MTAPIILKGSTKLLRPAITQLMAIHQLLENLDIESNSNDSEFYGSRRYNPQIRLFFKEDTDYNQNTNEPGYQGRRRLVGQLTFRLMDETSESIGKGELTQIATKIKNIFGANNGYIWEKVKNYIPMQTGLKVINYKYL